jgi:hypothetical protein
MPTWSSIKNAQITLQTGGKACGLYANGQNTVGVVLYFETYDENGKPYPITSSEAIANSWLIDYIDETPLVYYGGSGWAYSPSAGRFNRVPNVSQSEERKMDVVDESMLVSNGCYVTYYVYAYEGVSQKTIGFKIQAGKTMYYASNKPNSNYKANVAITPLDALSFNFSNCKTWGETVKSTPYQNQYNQYLQRTDGGKFTSMQCSSDSGPSPWSIISKNEAPNWHIIWPLGPSSSATFTGGFGFWYNGDPLYYNQYDGAVCASRFWHDKGTNTGYMNTYQQCTFTVWDDYGNSGVFSLARREVTWGNTMDYYAGYHDSKNGD